MNKINQYPWYSYDVTPHIPVIQKIMDLLNKGKVVHFQCEINYLNKGEAIMMRKYLLLNPQQGAEQLYNLITTHCATKFKILK